jgi:flagellar biosynthesis protein FlhF
MIYKVFRGSNYKEAVLKAKMGLGNNVYILARKELKEGGFLGMGAKNVTEITVAKNEDEQRVEQQKTADAHRNISSTAKPPSKGDQNLILKELNDIKTRLEGILDHKQESPHLQKFITMLSENDFSEDFIRKIRSKIENELTVKEVHDPKVMEEKLRGYLLESIETSGPIEIGRNGPTVVVLIGPTGVGKTTTIAKLAASYGIMKKHKVELLTIDSYRIAAIEQLGKYAELMQLPFTVINTREEFKSAIKTSNAEIIFVDTAGRSQKNNLGLAELRNILDGVRTGLDIHLVISATTKYRDALDIMTRFNQLMYDKVIVSKIDETNTIGSMLSVLNKDKRLSYFTTGQSVPDDIEIAEKDKILELITLEEFCA